MFKILSILLLLVTGCSHTYVDEHPDRFLVVISYGKGWTTNSSGNGLRETAVAIREKCPGIQVITRGWNDKDNIIDLAKNRKGSMIFIGHSFGGDQSVLFARQIPNTYKLILIDPVPFEREADYFTVPATVQKALCFHRSRNFWPKSYPISNESDDYQNVLMDLRHGAFCSNPKVREMILQFIP